MIKMEHENENKKLEKIWEDILDKNFPLVDKLSEKDKEFEALALLSKLSFRSITKINNKEIFDQILERFDNINSKLAEKLNKTRDKKSCGY